MATAELVETVKELFHLLDVADKRVYVIQAFGWIYQIIFDTITSVPALFNAAMHLV